MSNEIKNVLGKYTLRLPENDKHVSSSLKQHGIWEWNTTEFIKERLGEGQVFIDVGAHVGYYSILASDIVGDKGQVFSFEPSENNNEFLVDNLKDNKCENVNVLKLGLSNTEGDVALFKGEDAGGYSII